MKLENKVAIVTGSGSGIGRTTARLFASEGARLVIGDLDEAAGEATARLIRDDGGQAVFIKTDVAQPEDAAAMVKTAISEFGGLDILHNNAGITGGRNFVGDTDDDYWNRVIAVNLNGVYQCSKYAVREMLERGSGAIVNTTSIMGLVGLPGNAAYAASKGAVIQFTRTMALEYAPKGIRVNAVAAGWIDTPFNDILDEKLVNWSTRETPMGRWGKPEDIAKAALYLASDDSSFVTGHTLVVDGGWTIK
jgi:NAD(P)-dependent dehydrogenase (short-subunit alcohol dehydrogenase family)